MAATSAPATKWRLPASAFGRLHEAGAFAGLRKTELIDGDVYELPPHMVAHSRAMTRLTMALAERLTATGSDLEIILGVSVVVAPDSVPEPDIVVTSYTGDRYVPAETVSLVVEVAEATLPRDLGRKAELYAAARIPEYWVVDVSGRLIVTHRRPGIDGYAERGEAPFGADLAWSAIAGLTVGTAALLHDPA